MCPIDTFLSKVILKMY